jgi:hypothetical protein
MTKKSNKAVMGAGAYGKCSISVLYFIFADGFYADRWTTIHPKVVVVGHWTDDESNVCDIGHQRQDYLPSQPSQSIRDHQTTVTRITGFRAQERKRLCRYNVGMVVWHCVGNGGMRPFRVQRIKVCIHFDSAWR